MAVNGVGAVGGELRGSWSGYAINTLRKHGEDLVSLVSAMIMVHFTRGQLGDSEYASIHGDHSLLCYLPGGLGGTQLLRAALSLQRAGKDAALGAIDAFIEGRVGDGEWRVSDLDDERVVGMITHLVFEPKDGSPRPPRYICFFSFEVKIGSEALMKQWPNGAVMFSGGIPFVSGPHGYGFSGMIPPIDRFSEWIRVHGRVREQSFEPTVDPLDAAEKLLSAPFIKAITEGNEEQYSGTVQVNYIRRQEAADRR